MATVHNDLALCEKFRIQRQAVSGSGPHFDMVGIITYTTLAGNKADVSPETDDDIIEFRPSVLQETSSSTERWDESMQEL
jgi:hypothetical protein